MLRYLLTCNEPNIRLADDQHQRMREIKSNTLKHLFLRLLDLDRPLCDFPLFHLCFFSCWFCGSGAIGKRSDAHRRPDQRKPDSSAVSAGWNKYPHLAFLPARWSIKPCQLWWHRRYGNNRNNGRVKTKTCISQDEGDLQVVWEGLGKFGIEL